MRTSGDGTARARRATSQAAVVGLLWLAACGADVDLGGTLDGSVGVVDARDDARCSALVAPDVAAPCEACTPGSAKCQANGCYGGFWCNTAARDCREAPPSCP